MIRRLPGYAFRSSPPLMRAEAWQELLEERVGNVYLGLYENDQPVACTAYVPMTQHVRGQILRMGGVYDVVTHPAARRKGYARCMMNEIFALMRNDGCPVTSLYPFRESFYERLGYVSFLQPRWAKLKPANLGGMLKKHLAGQVELCLLSECFDRYHKFLKEYQRERHGMGLFLNRPIVPGKRRDFWVAFAVLDGQDKGAMLYFLKGERELEFDLRALRFYYLDVRARYLLLDWIARHVDQARSAELLIPPYEKPETWLADLEITTTSEFFNGSGRVLDITGMAGNLVGPGSISVRIVDPDCPWNEGVWRFVGEDGLLQVSWVEGKEDLPSLETLSIQALSALVYGTHDPLDFAFRGWGDPSPELVQKMKVMFPPEQPYLHEFF